MSTTATVETVRVFVIENFLFGEEGDFDDNTSFLESGIIDSTGIIELIAFLETKFEITVEDDELLPGNFDTLNNISRFVQGKTNSQ